MNPNHKTAPFTLLLLSGKDAPRELAQNGASLTVSAFHLLKYVPSPRKVRAG